uniref:Uncharacterized protein n=1 Tax=Arion vulgaris TaxID=1028688 RepID=A0A0B6ZZ16_9EUPU
MCGGVEGWVCCFSSKEYHRLYGVVLEIFKDGFFELMDVFLGGTNRNETV